ncbi:MAG: biotin/lipoyl-binding protein, partial [Lachnospiraceae bacterium]|nr:biotin/lipoyl-binding protein [Lachnospiraceae bacterium]
MGDIKKKSRKKRIIGVAIAGVLIASLIIAGLIKKKDASKETDQITTERLQKRTIVTSVSGSGTIEATASENVTSTMTGSKVKSVEVKVGDVVTANQTIAIMDTSNLEEQKKTLNAQITALKKQEADAKKAAEDAKSALDESASSQAARNQEAINALSASITSQQAKLDADKATLQSMKDTYQSNYASTPTNADAIQYQQLIL